MNVGILFCGISYGIQKDRDFAHCYPNINKTIIQPLEDNGNIIRNYLCTYDNPKIEELKVLYNTNKCLILPFDGSKQVNTRFEGLKFLQDEDLDFIIMGRFDVHYNMSILDTKIDFDKFNIVSKEGNGYWSRQQWTGDTFYAFPKKFFDGFYKSFIDLLNTNYDHQHMHNLYPILSNHIGSENINFMFDNEQLSGHEFNSICTKYYVDMHRNNFKINDEVLARFPG